MQNVVNEFWTEDGIYDWVEVERQLLLALYKLYVYQCNDGVCHAHVMIDEDGNYHNEVDDGDIRMVFEGTIFTNEKETNR